MNSCITYFSIDGDFDPAEITALLGLQPDSGWRKGDMSPHNDPYAQSFCSFGYCEEYHVFTSEQVRKTIAPLLSKVDVLRAFRQGRDITYTIEIVPQVYVGESTPALGADTDIIEFCHAVGAQIDIDMYVYPEEK